MKHAGYDEISLMSLSSADTCVRKVASNLFTSHKDQGISVSLPSSRVDSFSVDLAKEVQGRRIPHIAPEAAHTKTQRRNQQGVT